jgi:hypothetical protein
MWDDDKRYDWDSGNFIVSISKPVMAHSAFFDKYRRIHKYCPRCGSGRVSRTVVGVPFDPNNKNAYKDKNIATCDFCGWKGIVHDLVPGRNVRK